LWDKKEKIAGIIMVLLVIGSGISYYIYNKKYSKAEEDKNKSATSPKKKKE
jgi:uncharacterized membrane protein